MALVNVSRKAGLVFSSSSEQPRRDSAPKQEAKRSTPSANPPFQKDEFEPAKKMNSQYKYKNYSKPGEPSTVFRAPTLDLRNVASPAQFSKGGWVQTTPILQQSKPKMCGAAVAAMLGGSKQPEKMRDPRKYMSELVARTTDGYKGTTPQEMAKMLAYGGVEVTRSVKQFDSALAKSTLMNGDKLVALVDSGALDPKGNAGQPGAAHWVVIDGIDKHGNFLVRNPATGQSEYLPPSQLEKAVADSWDEHGGGGMMTVRNAPKASESGLEEENLKHAATLGKRPGGGSPGAEASGREAHN
ncbi:MAG TPA: papain-like cysteine protease family protein [Myxococcaceae bacterium]